MEEYLKNSNIVIKDGKIVIPDWVKSIKIDVGISYDAPHTQNWIDNNPDTMVFCFEANPGWIKYINTPPEHRDYNFKDYLVRSYPYKELDYNNIGKKCFIIPVALNNTTEPTFMDFYIPENSEGCCSLLKPKETLGSIKNIVKVPVFRLSDFLKFLPDDKIIDYLKIDVQGVDLNVLKSADEYIKKVVFVTAEPETNDYEGATNNSPENIIKYMEDNGFYYISHSNTRDPTFLNKNFIHLANDIYIFQYY